MIKANELRIGNTININGETVHGIGYGVIQDVAQINKGFKNSYLDTLIQHVCGAMLILSTYIPCRIYSNL